MTKQTIDIGSVPNDGNGDPLRDAGTKINQNFTEVYQGLSAAGTFDTGALVANTSKTVSHGLNIDADTVILIARDDSDSNNITVKELKPSGSNNFSIMSVVDLSNLKVKIIGIKL